MKSGHLHFDLDVTAPVIVGEENGFKMLSHGINVPIKLTLCISGRGSIAERIKDLGRLGLTIGRANPGTRSRIDFSSQHRKGCVPIPLNNSVNLICTQVFFWEFENSSECIT